MEDKELYQKYKPSGTILFGDCNNNPYQGYFKTTTAGVEMYMDMENYQLIIRHDYHPRIVI